jgi:hypothetical protein
MVGFHPDRGMLFVAGLPYNRTATKYRSLAALGMTILKGI